MATQTVEFSAASGLTVTAKLFSAGSDTEVASVSATEKTNDKGTYSAAYTDLAAGTYRVTALSDSIPVAKWWVTVTAATATFQAYEVPEPVVEAEVVPPNPYCLLETTIATYTSTTSFTLTHGVATDDYYNGKEIVVIDTDNSQVRSTVRIADYVGSTKTVTLESAIGFTGAIGDSVYVLAGVVFKHETDGVITDSFTSQARNQLANTPIEVIGTMGPAGSITLIKGDDYTAGEVFFEQTASESWADFNNEGDKVTFEVVPSSSTEVEVGTSNTVDIECEREVQTGSVKKVTCNLLTSTVTNGLAAGTYNYHLRCVYNTGVEKTLRLGKGKLTVLARYKVADA